MGPGIFASAFTQPLREEGAPIRMTDRPPPTLLKHRTTRLTLKEENRAPGADSHCAGPVGGGGRAPAGIWTPRAITPSCSCAATAPSAISSWIWWRSSRRSWGCGSTLPPRSNVQPVSHSVGPRYPLTVVVVANTSLAASGYGYGYYGYVTLQTYKKSNRL